ncbi:MAG: GNAT family N-acetyltransferase [Erysipelotrichia bacterium]|nr:GNAT family N-acetyltransferase [Erysipelotrichia bacterium]
MESEFINLTKENIAQEHLSCIIRSRKLHPGVEAKRAWLSDRLAEGHVFRKLNAKGTVFIEYAPLETAWVPVIGDQYLYLYCLWTSGEYRGKGYGRQLLDYCIEDAKASGKSGICMLGADKQKGWLTDQSFAIKHGFRKVDTAEGGYQLLAYSLDGTVPRFAPSAKAGTISDQQLTIYYDHQCPYVIQAIDTVQNYCTEQKIPVHFIEVKKLKQAKQLPCVFNNWAVFYKGTIQNVNLIVDINVLKRIVRE